MRPTFEPKPLGALMYCTGALSSAAPKSPGSQPPASARADNATIVRRILEPPRGGKPSAVRHAEERVDLLIANDVSEPGSGFGSDTNLMKNATEAINLIAHGYDDAVLWVLADNQRARTFYEMAGWRADGGIKHDTIGGREIEEVRYRLTLERSRVAELV